MAKNSVKELNALGESLSQQIAIIIKATEIYDFIYGESHIFYDRSDESHLKELDAYLEEAEIIILDLLKEISKYGIRHFTMDIARNYLYDVFYGSSFSDHYRIKVIGNHEIRYYSIRKSSTFNERMGSEHKEELRSLLATFIRNCLFV